MQFNVVVKVCTLSFEEPKIPAVPDIQIIDGKPRFPALERAQNHVNRARIGGEMNPKMRGVQIALS
jgi:hypothetical protein